MSHIDRHGHLVNYYYNCTRRLHRFDFLSIKNLCSLLLCSFIINSHSALYQREMVKVRTTLIYIL